MILDKNILLDYILTRQDYKLENTDNLGLYYEDTTDIVYSVIKDYLGKLGLGNLYVYTENKNVYISYEYGKNRTRIEIKIKRKKTGVNSGYFKDYGLYVITDIELSDTDLNKVLQAKIDSDTSKETSKIDFLTELQKHNLSINDFLDLYKKYDKLDYMKKMEIEKKF